MIIEVYRYEGDVVGAPLNEPLLSDAALVVRGTEEMDSNAQQVDHVTMDITPTAGIRLGDLIEMIDITSATPVRGKVTGITINISEADISMGLTVEQPR